MCHIMGNLSENREGCGVNFSKSVYGMLERLWQENKLTMSIKNYPTFKIAVNDCMLQFSISDLNWASAAIFEELLKGMNIFENHSPSAEKLFESLGPGRFLFERIISLYIICPMLSIKALNMFFFNLLTLGWRF